MSGPNNRKNKSNENRLILDQQTIKDIVEQQKLQAEVNKSRVELEKLSLKENAQLAKMQIQSQEKILLAKPTEVRKGRFQLMGFVVTVLIVIMIFSHLCLEGGHEEFLTYFVQGVVYLTSVALAYFAGSKKSKRSTDRDDSMIEDAEVIDD